MSKTLNRKAESRKHAYALVFKLGYHEIVDVQKAFDYYLEEYIEEYVEASLIEPHSTSEFKEERNGLKSVAQYISEGINKEYIYQVFSGTSQNLEEIDQYIEKFTKGWKIARLDKAVLAVLRLAIYEMKFMDTIPLKVSVQEALNIAKDYCGEDTVKFVNGVLGSVIKDLETNAV